LDFVPAGTKSNRLFFYPPSRDATAVKPWMNVNGGSPEAVAPGDASADSAEVMEDTTGVPRQARDGERSRTISPWRLHLISVIHWMILCSSMWLTRLTVYRKASTWSGIFARLKTINLKPSSLLLRGRLFNFVN